MRDERGSIEFEADLANLLIHLRYLWRDGKIELVDCFLFTRRVRRSRTREELKAIAGDLARIYRSRIEEDPERGPGKKGFSANRPHEKGVHL